MIDSNAEWLEVYRLLKLGRTLETTLCKNPKLAGYHAAIGEEATIVGSFYGLEPEDVILPHYRGTLLAAYTHGADLRKLIAGALLKKTAYNKSRFRGDICPPAELSIIGLFSGILGSTLNFASGAGISQKMKGEGKVAVVTFGEGTSNLGAFHENLNLAACLNLPVVFVCQNNQYAISTNYRRVMKCNAISDRALGYGMPGVTVDGNSFHEVHDAVTQAVSRARNGEGPSLIEAVTYRLAGHFAIDPAAYQNEVETAQWKKRDPVEGYLSWLLQRDGINKEAIEKINQRVSEEFDEAYSLAQEDPEPGEEHLGLGEIYAPAT